MNIPRPPSQALVPALNDIFEHGSYADRAIESVLRKNKNWNDPDRRFFAETVYGMVRWWRQLWAIAGEDPSIEEHKLWLVFAVWLWKQNGELPKWQEFAALSTSAFAEGREKLKGRRALEESIPDWLDELGEGQLGGRWPAVLHALNRPPEVVLRLNASRSTLADLIGLLEKEGVHASGITAVPGALKLVKSENVFRSTAFRNGLFEVQDAASQCVVPLLGLRSGQRVIDACAGAGGKTLQIADTLAGSGRVIALDTAAKRLEELRKRARRSGFSTIETKLIENSKVIKRLDQSADRVLLDVPCSGTGALRRNPEIKWNLNQEKLDRCLALQANLLQRYSRMAKVGGRLVYATCSVLPIENDQQVQAFLDRNKDRWRLVEEKWFWPDQFGYDGFYAACLERTAK